MQRPARRDQVQRQCVAQEIEDAFVGAEPACPRFLDRLRDQRAIMRGRTRRGEIGAVDREMQDVELERLPQAIGGKVASGIVTAGDAREQPPQHREFGRQQRLQHAALGL